LPDEIQGKGRFRRKIENFSCIRCGSLTRGNGYTDHCASCLASKHVDNMPGDRSEKCHGIMRAERTVYARGNYTIYYVCEKCGARKSVGASPDDNIDALEKLISV
jgi:rubrerythrin